MPSNLFQNPTATAVSPSFMLDNRFAGYEPGFPIDFGAAVIERSALTSLMTSSAEV